MLNNGTKHMQLKGSRGFHTPVMLNCSNFEVKHFLENQTLYIIVFFYNLSFSDKKRSLREIKLKYFR
jgi:hypothetical protein